MFTDLFGTQKFDVKCLVSLCCSVNGFSVSTPQTRFFITVRKNYREVSYHNWTHGFHVANSAYAMLKSCSGTFRPLEVGQWSF